MKTKLFLFFTLLTFVACARFEGPCDIYEANGTPCVTAHSTVRRLNSKYNGPLYQLMRDKDGATLDVGFTKDGYADVEAHEAFTKGELCYISVIYDQSGMGNDLFQAAPGTFKGPAKGDFNTISLSDMAPIIVNGHKAYGVYIMPGMGYRNNNARGLAIADEPEGIYSVVDGTHFSNGCCFDYGNASTNGVAVGTGTMETTYYGTATAWGRGNDEGPWIMVDMEAGLFSGYHHKQNDVPAITDWRFVSIFVNGGGGNQWDLRGGDATKEGLTTYYSGVRPHTPERSDYFPMDKRGGLLLGNGGDNGNGSAGTFYEGVMTFGYPTDAAIEAVQKNIAAQKYDEPRVEQTRLVSFENNETQELAVRVKNTSDSVIDNYEVCIELPNGWGVEGEMSQKITKALEPGAKANVIFKIVAPQAASSGYVNTYFKWGHGKQDFASQRVRSSAPIKINEVLLANASGTSEQFIELYNNSNHDVNVGNWTIASRPAGKETAVIATLPEGQVIKANDFLLARLAPSSITAPVVKGSKEIYLSRNLAKGTKIVIGREEYTIANQGVAAAAPTNLFIPVSTGPWLDFSKNSTNLPLASVEGFANGHLMAIDVDGANFETIAVKSVGRAATQTYLAEAAVAGQNIIKLEVTENLVDGDIITISTGDRTEIKKIKKVISLVSPAPRRMFGAPAVVHIPGEVELETPLEKNHAKAVDVATPGLGVDLVAGTKLEHRSGETVQSLGLPYTLDRPLNQNVNKGTVVKISGNTYGADILFSNELSQSAGAIILYADDVVVDAIVYGSQQSNSSANGTIAAPEIATLEADQSQGGCIAVVPQRNRRWPITEPKPEELMVDLVRYPDGNDKDSLCEDFRSSPSPTPGAANVR